MNLFKKNYVLMIALVLLAFVLVFATACGNSNEQAEDQQAEDAEKGKIVFSDPGWESVRFHDHVAGQLIKLGYGYEYDIIPGSTPVTLQGLRNGDIDIQMESWTNNIQEIYEPALESGDILETSVNYDDNSQGIYVPTYIIEGDSERGIEASAPDLKSITDLPEYWELFKDPEDKSKGRIIGSPAGWKVDEILGAKMGNYNLEDTYNYFRPGSGAALAADISKAYEAGDPWVGYYWEPTWIMGKYDMTLLEEPEYSDEKWEDYNCEFPAVKVTTNCHKGLPEKAPELYEFIQKYETSSSLANEALAYMQDNDAEAKDAAIWFLKEHEEIWTKWVPEDIAEKVKAAIEE